MLVPGDPAGLTELLVAAGFLAAHEEADQLLAAAGGDNAVLGSLVERRLTGEPLAWITGRVVFCGADIGVHHGVYVPRWQSEALARRACERLPTTGIAVDVCTGSGAIAAVLSAARPAALVLATDIDERAVACAIANGVAARCGDLFDPLPATMRGRVDVVVSVAPYVPTLELPLLQRDTLTFESPLAYDGGPDGTDILRRVLTESSSFLRPGGALLLELGGDQAALLAPDLDRLGYGDATVLRDEEGDARGLEVTRAASP